VSDLADSQKIDESKRERLKLRILSVVGYLLPLVVSAPALGAWTLGMTLPLILYLFVLLTTGSLFSPELLSFWLSIPLIILLFWSVFYLHQHKQSGLVIKGPYRYVRHPQYFFLIVFTLILTFQSVWILWHTLGTGWLSAEETILLWVGMLVAYVGIAWIEEIHLKEVYDLEWDEYRNRVGFLIPYVNFKSRALEAIVSIFIPLLVLYGSLYIFR